MKGNPMTDTNTQGEYRTNMGFTIDQIYKRENRITPHGGVGDDSAEKYLAEDLRSAVLDLHDKWNSAEKKLVEQVDEINDDFSSTEEQLKTRDDMIEKRILENAILKEQLKTADGQLKHNLKVYEDRYTEYADTIERYQRRLTKLETCGIIELMQVNPNVKIHVEDREREITRLKQYEHDLTKTDSPQPVKSGGCPDGVRLHATGRPARNPDKSVIFSVDGYFSFEVSSNGVVAVCGLKMEKVLRVYDITHRYCELTPAQQSAIIKKAEEVRAAYVHGYSQEEGISRCGIRCEQSKISLSYRVTCPHCLAKMKPAESKCLYPLGCNCSNCVEKYGPIHEGNIGKDLRNKTPFVSNPRSLGGQTAESEKPKRGPMELKPGMFWRIDEDSQAEGYLGFETDNGWFIFANHCFPCHEPKLNIITGQVLVNDQWLSVSTGEPLEKIE